MVHSSLYSSASLLLVFSARFEEIAIFLTLGRIVCRSPPSLNRRSRILMTLLSGHMQTPLARGRRKPARPAQPLRVNMKCWSGDLTRAAQSKKSTAKRMEDSQVPDSTGKHLDSARRKRIKKRLVEEDGEGVTVCRVTM